MKFLLLLVAAFALTRVSPAVANTAPAVANTPGITAHHGEVYETLKAGSATQGFVDIDNGTKAGDTLTGIACPVAGASSIVGPNGAAISKLPVAAGKTLKLSPGGPHIQLQATHFSIDLGGAIPCRLTFENAGPVQVYLYVTPAP